MKYIIRTRELFDSDNVLIKELDCPLSKRWDDLLPWSEDWLSEGERLKRYCDSCQKAVVDVNSFSEDQIKALCEAWPSACIHLRSDHPELIVHVERDSTGESDDPDFVDVGGGIDFRSNDTQTIECRGSEQYGGDGTPVVHTARSLAALKEAVRKGFRPWFVVPRREGKIWQKLSIRYLPERQDVSVIGDYRMGFFDDEAAGEHQSSSSGVGVVFHEELHKHPSPLAVYLIPPDIEPGTRVYVADVIEELIGSKWNQGDTYRQHSAYAVWTGSGMEFDPQIGSFVEFVG